MGSSRVETVDQENEPVYVEDIDWSITVRAFKEAKKDSGESDLNFMTRSLCASHSGENGKRARAHIKMDSASS